MTEDRSGGVALIAGSVGMILTMVLHPTGADLFEGDLDAAAHMVVGAHGLGILSLPVLYLGTLGLARRMAGSWLGTAGLVVYGFAVVAGMAAAVFSGFVAPEVAREIAGGGEGEETWWIVFHYNGLLNEAFASVLVVASSLSILLWSIAILRSGTLAAGLGVYGLLLSPAVVLAHLSGHLHLDVHGFGLVVLGQATWFVIGGAQMCRRVA